jgi:hypothetical protein
MITSTVATVDDGALAVARALGRAEAQRFELDMRSLELAERERIRSSRGDASIPSNGHGPAPGPDTVTFDRLRREEAELAAFHAAVLRSRPWRLAEAMRGVFGRAWNAPSRKGYIEPVDLEQRVQELAHFRSAVLGSRVWRLLQRLRRVVGREW